MDQEREIERFATAEVVYSPPGAESVHIVRDVPFTGADGEPLAFDVYSPPPSDETPLPVVVIVGGYPDPGFERIFGRRFKEIGPVVSWARSIAASGLVAVAYTNRQPEADLLKLFDHLDLQGKALGIDADRLGVWASSGNASVALSMQLKWRARRPRCAALLYPYLMDLDGATAVATAAATFRFVNPCAGCSLDDLAPDVPILLARAGKDEMPQLNWSMDQFASAALSRNLPLTVVNHSTGPHAFDLFDDSETSRRVVRAVLAFLRDHLS